MPACAPAFAALKTSPQESDQPRGKAAVRIEIGIEDRDGHPGAAPVGDQAGENDPQLVRIDARTAGRIDRRHDRLVEHVDVEMQEERPILLADGGKRARHDRLGAALARIEHVDAVEGSLVDVGPDEAGAAPLALADLHHLLVGHQRRRHAGPFGHQRVAAAGCQRQVHAGHRALHGPGVIVSRMAEIAVSVDMDERQRARPAQPGQRAEQHRAIAADDQRKPALRRGLFDIIGEFQVEAPERMAVAQQRSRLRLGAIGWPLEVDDRGGTDRVDQPGIAQRLRRPPGAGHMAAPQRAQAEIAGRTDQ